MKKKTYDIDKNDILDFLATMIRHEKRESSLLTKILGFVVGISLIGLGWGYGTMAAANDIGLFNMVTVEGFLKISLGVSVGFIGFMIVHKGLRGYRI